jgi:hypothetical protein
VSVDGQRDLRIRVAQKLRNRHHVPTRREHDTA